MKQLLLLCAVLLCACSKTKDIPVPTKAKSNHIIRNLDGEWHALHQKNTLNNCFYGTASPQNVKLDDIKSLLEFCCEDHQADQLKSSNRKIVYRNVEDILNVNFGNTKDTRLSTDVCIDRDGNVLLARINENTTVQLKDVHKEKMLQAIGKYKYTKSTNDACIECGELNVHFTNIKRVN